MALGSTVVGFEIALSDVDRGVYETLSLKAAQHPSETSEYLVARVLAYALEHTEGIVFTAEGATGDTPALLVRDLTGQLIAWIDIGTPDAARLHKASKAAERVAVYCHKEPTAWLRGLVGQRVHAPERVSLWVLPREPIARIAAALERRNVWSLSRIDGELYLEAGELSVGFPLEPAPWPT